MSPSSTESSGGSGGLEATILSDLGSVEDSSPAVDSTTAEEIAAVPGDEEPVTEGTEEETPAEEEQPAEKAPVEDDSQKPEIPNLEQSRWQRVHSGYRWAREVGKALGIVGEDGRVDVTLFPSVEEIQGMRTAYSDRIAMEHDFASGAPENAQIWVDNWNKFSPQGMTAVAATLPEYLATQNPEGYMAMASPIVQRFIDQAYQSGRNETDPERRDYILGVARAMEWWATGGYENGVFRPDGPQAVQQPSAAEQQLARVTAELQRRDNEAAQARWNWFSNGVRERVGPEVNKAVDEALAPLKPAYNQATYGAVRDQFQRKLNETLRADAPGQRQYQIAMERARQSQQPQDQEALANLWLTMVRRAVHAIRGPFVSEASKGIKQASDARHAALANGASKIAPTAGGAPRAQSIAPLQRKATETAAEYQYRQIAHDLGA